jgi:hypothetical protein
MHLLLERFGLIQTGAKKLLSVWIKPTSHLHTPNKTLKPSQERSVSTINSFQQINKNRQIPLTYSNPKPLPSPIFPFPSQLLLPKLTNLRGTLLSNHKNLITHLSNFNPNVPPNRLCSLSRDHPFPISIPNLPSNQQKLVVPFPPSNVSHSSSPHLHLRFLSYKPTTFHNKITCNISYLLERGVALTQSLLSNWHSKAFMILRGANVPPSLPYKCGCVI